MTTRVILADDHTLMRQGLRALLHGAGDIQVVGEAASGREALQLAQQCRPDIVLMDITMPDLNGIEAARSIRQKLPDTRIVMLSMHMSSEYVYRAFDAGASGYLLKEMAVDEVLTAVRSVQMGKAYLSPALALSLPARNATLGRGPIDSLSNRERQVLQLVVEGHTSSDIAGKVNLSPKSVDTYRSRLMAKLGVEDLPALVKFALEHGLTPSS